MRSSIKKQQSSNLVNIIDEIFTHHYFHQKLEEALEKKSVSNKFCGSDGLLDEEYFKSENQIFEEISSSIQELIAKQVRNILDAEYININEQISAIKQQIYTFTNEQHKLTESMKKQIVRVGDQLRRKNLVNGITNNPMLSNPIGSSTGIRFTRNSQKNYEQIHTQVNQKSYHSQLVAMKKEIEDVKASVQNMEGIKFLRDQFNEYKLENKILVESLNQRVKKMAEDSQIKRPSSGRANSSNSENIKEYIDTSVKRSLKALSSVYSSYAGEISEIKEKIEELHECMQKFKEQNIQYMSKQLKSVWLVLNDLKRSIDSVVERNNLDMSMEIL